MLLRRSVAVMSAALILWASTASLVAQNCLDCSPVRSYNVSVSGTYEVQIWSSVDFNYSVDSQVAAEIENGVNSYIGTFFDNHNVNVHYNFTHCQVDGMSDCPSGADIVVYFDDAENMYNQGALAEAYPTGNMRFPAKVVISNEYVGSSQPWANMAAHEFMHLLGFINNMPENSTCPAGSSILQPLQWTLPSTLCSDLLALTNSFYSLPTMDTSTAEYQITGDDCWDVYAMVIYYCYDGTSTWECGWTPWMYLGNTCNNCCWWFYT